MNEPVGRHRPASEIGCGRVVVLVLEQDQRRHALGSGVSDEAVQRCDVDGRSGGRGSEPDVPVPVDDQRGLIDGEQQVRKRCKHAPDELQNVDLHVGLQAWACGVPRRDVDLGDDEPERDEPRGRPRGTHGVVETRRSDGDERRALVGDAVADDLPLRSPGSACGSR